MSENRCYGCMRMKSDGAFCDQCGYPVNTSNPVHTLPAGTMLQDKYLLGRVLGQNQYGIAYLALDCNLDVTVVVQEYYPVDIVSRNCENSLMLSLKNSEAVDNFSESVKK